MSILAQTMLKYRADEPARYNIILMANLGPLIWRRTQSPRSADFCRRLGVYFRFQLFSFPQPATFYVVSAFQNYPALPSRICQIIRQSLSFSPRSITCNGVEPSNASFGRCSHGPIDFALIISDKASKSRVTSRIFCALDRCGATPAFQYETVRGDAPVTLLTASFERL